MWLSKVSYRKRLCVTMVLLGTYSAMAIILLHANIAMYRTEQAEPSSYRICNNEEPSVLNVTHDIRNNIVHGINNTTIFIQPELEKIDWNDYNFMAQEAQRKGLGEHGVAAVLSLSGTEKELKEELFKKFNYNAYISDHISLERSIGDLRSTECKKQKFIRNIPQNSLSVIVVFYNEKNSTILRTVHSIINRSPAQLLREIVLVDDLSTLDEVKTPLDVYISQHFSKVRVIRNTERIGLIRSRIAGADSSSGSFLLFLDAHVEVNHNYLPPLLEPMVIDYKTITCPIIEIIDFETFKVLVKGKRSRGAFNWGLDYIRIPVHGMDETTPHASPVMVGCAFAITRQWWEKLGKYDTGLEIWGAEQYELSFKTWQCGGSLVDAPCSKVVHLFRPLPYVKEVTQNNRIEKNYQRLTSVWMDEYKEFVLKRRPEMLETDAGNITQQIALRKRLKCKSFKWFMDEIAPDIIQYYPKVEPPIIAWGQIQSRFNNSLCVIQREQQLYLDDCVKHLNENKFVFNYRRHLKLVNKCLTILYDNVISTWECLEIEQILTQAFAWNQLNGHIVSFATNMCLDYNVTTFHLLINKCDDFSTTQSWHFGWFNNTEVNRVWWLYTSSATKNNSLLTGLSKSKE